LADHPTLEGWRWALFPPTLIPGLVAGPCDPAFPRSPRWLAAWAARRKTRVVARDRSAGRGDTHRAPARGHGTSPESQEPVRGWWLRSEGFRQRVTGPRPSCVEAVVRPSLVYLYCIQTSRRRRYSRRGHAIVNHFGYSVVILGGTIPAYVLGGNRRMGSIRKFAILLAFPPPGGVRHGFRASPPNRGVHGVSGTHIIRAGPRSVRSLHLHPGACTPDGSAVTRTGGSRPHEGGWRDHGPSRLRFCSRRMGSHCCFYSDSILIAGLIVVHLPGRRPVGGGSRIRRGRRDRRWAGAISGFADRYYRAAGFPVAACAVARQRLGDRP